MYDSVEEGRGGQRGEDPPPISVNGRSQRPPPEPPLCIEIVQGVTLILQEPGEEKGSETLNLREAEGDVVLAAVPGDVRGGLPNPPAGRHDDPLTLDIEPPNGWRQSQKPHVDW